MGKDRQQNIENISLNCRSLKNHIRDIRSDDMLMKSDIICLQETWLEDDVATEILQIENYDLHLNSNGKGKGIAIYFKKDTLKHEIDIKEESMQLSKFRSDALDLVVLYRSQNGNQKNLTETLEKLIEREKPLLVIGDFNFCFLDDSTNLTKRYLNENFFSQLVNEPTHIEGNLIDQAHVRDTKGVNKYSIELHSKYYTDHKGLAVLIKSES